MVVDGGAALTLSSSFANHGFLKVGWAKAASLTVADAFDNSGTVYLGFSRASTIAAGSIVNTGFIQIFSGDLVTNSFTNNGGIDYVDGGPVDVAILGTGYIYEQSGLTVEFDASVSAGQDFTFATNRLGFGASGTVALAGDALTSFHALLQNWDDDCFVDLKGWGAGTAITGFANDVLTITHGAQSAHLAFDPSTGDPFSLNNFVLTVGAAQSVLSYVANPS